jgi:hypothetical protein
MKKLLFPIFVILSILHPKTTLVQDGKSFHQAEFTQQVSSPVQANAQSDDFDLDNNVSDFTDDNLNDSEKKDFSIQHIAFSTSNLVARPGYDHFFKSKWNTQSNLAFKSPLFILNRVFRI